MWGLFLFHWKWQRMREKMICICYRVRMQPVKFFGGSSGISQHLKDVHEAEIYCHVDSCFKKFANIETLKRHNNTTIHHPKRILLCSKCKLYTPPHVQIPCSPTSNVVMAAKNNTQLLYITVKIIEHISIILNPWLILELRKWSLNRWRRRRQRRRRRTTTTTIQFTLKNRLSWLMIRSKRIG